MPTFSGLLGLGAADRKTGQGEPNTRMTGKVYVVSHVNI